MLNAAQQATILVVVCAVIPFTKMFGWVELPMNAETTALDRALLSEIKRITRTRLMGGPFHSTNRIIMY
ncbi:hypothetical protein ACTRXD_17575 [Nitrospira sp. T9]|uniref:hypothetical protein n=1 Tax=unclassified Nitrospira TaxID=2652172 RepID=UPI003F993ED5